MPKSEEGKEYIIMTELELKLILESELIKINYEKEI